MADIELGELELRKPIEKVSPLVDVNRRAEPMGIIGPDDLKIFIPRPVFEGIIAHSNTTLDREVGGSLIGNLYAYRGVDYIEIEGYIPAERAVSLPASFRFTHDSFEARTRRMEREFPDGIVVGWHHTHPGYSVFLSSTDVYAHRTHFALPWMVAFVVDPKAETCEFFQWKGSTLAASGFYFVH